ncbi:MAG: hypothetical protein KGL57_07610 [Burkholderiales bacterium]|nr:hypothetical protein [Burkholderiales bacterium]
MVELNARQGIRATLPTGIALNRRGAQVCAQTRHIDALGLLLMQRRLRIAPLFNSYEVFGIRQWLGTARLMFPFRVNQLLFNKAFTQTYPELGPLTGDGGVSMIIDKAGLRRAWRHFEEVFLDFPHLEVLLHSPFALERTDICVVSGLDESPARWIDMTPSRRT